MKRKYMLINSEKINVPHGVKWLVLIGVGYLWLIVISLIEMLIHNLMKLDIQSIQGITFYLRVFIVLSLIYDLAPRFKRTISIIWSVLAFLIYIGIDFRSGDRLFLGSILFMILITLYNVFLWKKATVSKP